MTEEAKDAFRGAGRVAFLAREKEIKEMIEAGHPTKNVYRKYGDKLNISYGQFARYVNKFIRRKPDENQGKKPAAPATKPIRTREPGQPAFVSSDTPRDNLIKPKE